MKVELLGILYVCTWLGKNSSVIISEWACLSKQAGVNYICMAYVITYGMEIELAYSAYLFPSVD